MLLTPHICHLGPAGPDWSSAMLNSARAVADSSPYPTSSRQDLQVLARTQQHWIVADYLPHHKSVIQDVQVLTGNLLLLNLHFFWRDCKPFFLIAEVLKLLSEAQECGPRRCHSLGTRSRHVVGLHSSLWGGGKLFKLSFFFVTPSIRCYT